MAARNRLLLHFHQCPGDSLVASAAVSAFKTQYPEYRLKVEGGGSEAIYQHNPHVEGFDDFPDDVIRMDNPLVNESHLPWHFLHSYVKAINDHLGTHVRLQTGKPELYLSDDEKAWQPKYKGYWLVCQPGAKKDYTVKYWPHEYLQDVVDRLRGRVQFVQVGSAEHNHKPLRGVIDEIGKTDLRQLIRMAYHADGALTGESFLHHVMAAFSKPCVTVASGWLSKQWVNYPTCTLLSRHGCLPCCRDRACGQTRVVDLGDGDEKSRKLCHFPVLSFPEPVAKCMAMIGPDEVVRAIENYLEGERCSIYYTSSNTV